MSNDVFANGREISCKKADGKSICAFPDVCMTPPENPATPPGVPVPYPNTGMAKDTTSGSKKVKISGQEVLLKNKSYFKKSTGDEAGSAAKKGVVTSVNRGKVYFNAWSMDVKFEGENVVRHLDMTTHNHGSVPGNSPTWPYIDSQDFTSSHPCVKDAIKERTACNDYKPHNPKGKDACAEAGLTEKPSKSYDSEFQYDSGAAEDQSEALAMANRASAHECIAARRCNLKPYSPNQCCPGQTPHHLIEAASFFKSGVGNGRGGSKDGVSSVALDSVVSEGKDKYSEGKAPCVCAEGATQNVGTHGMMHTHQSTMNTNAPQGDLKYSDGSSRSCRKTTYKQAKENACEALALTFPNAGCNPDCIKQQLDNYHNQANITDDTEIEAIVTGGTADADVEHALTSSIARAK
jgi:hypothetical protein